MNAEKLKILEQQVRIGGKGSARRKKKVCHKTQGTDDKKLQANLKKLNCNTIPGIEEVNIIKKDCSVVNFQNPKVQGCLNSNTFIISGHGIDKNITEMLPGIIPQLGPDIARIWRDVLGDAKNVEEDDEIPELVGDFDTVENQNELSKEIKIENVPEN
ncbi:NAC-beta [Intoshia linei]|uniref:Transcription factor BTF3 n=1 Tax=Intoshia linei TaxID=1819745 RepID=A0A177B9Y5_9BILA|nr:NAC-beta [Intoshia linei]